MDNQLDSLPSTSYNKQPWKAKDADQHLAVAIRSNLEAGNFKAVIHILCSDDTAAPSNEETLQVLKDYYPGLPRDRRSPSDLAGNTQFIPLQISPDDVRRALRTLPSESSGGPEGLTTQHINDLLTGDTDGKLLNALTDLVNLLLAGRFDNEVNKIIFGDGLSSILNVDFDDTQWLQATLPVKNEGIGFRSAMMLAPSAFLASAASTLALQEAILPSSYRLVADDTKIKMPRLVYKILVPHSRYYSAAHPKSLVRTYRELSPPYNHRLSCNRCWPRQTQSSFGFSLWWLASHASDYFPGLKLTDDEVRISVALILGVRACSPHNCVCGKLVEARGLHGLSWRRSTRRHQRHAMLINIIWRSIKRAQIPAHKEPTGLVSQGGKRPDGVTMTPWVQESHWPGM